MTDNNTKKIWSKLSSISILLWVLVIVWMGVIFSFSAENDKKSAQTSGKITEKVTSEIVDNYDKLEEKERVAALSVMGTIVRKAGHFTEFFILGALLMAAFSSNGGIRPTKIGLSLLVCLLYAASDEFHQKFVDGRSPALFDVAIDTLGGAFGILIMLGVLVLIHAIRRSIKEKKGYSKTK